MTANVSVELLEKWIAVNNHVHWNGNDKMVSVSSLLGAIHSGALAAPAEQMSVAECLAQDLERIADMKDRDGNCIDMHRDELRGIARRALGFYRSNTRASDGGRSGWVSVEERLPEQGHTVLVQHVDDLYPISAYWLPEDGVATGGLIKYSTIHWHYEGDGPEDTMDCAHKHHELYRAPTHWMPLPPSPYTNPKPPEDKK
jgi:hypothetical protein